MVEDLVVHKATINLGYDFFTPIHFTEDGVRLCTNFFCVALTIRDSFLPKSVIFLESYFLVLGLISPLSFVSVFLAGEEGPIDWSLREGQGTN
jgi:hypothetical protein